MSGLFLQIKAFAATLLLGISAGFLFHFYQALITRAKVGRVLLYVLDFFLWIIMIGMVFYLMLFINGGEMRAYILLALLMGIVLYLSCFFAYCRGWVESSAELAVHIMYKLATIIQKPWLKLKTWIKAGKKPPADDD